MGRRGGVGRVWCSDGARDAGVGQRNYEKLTQPPFFLSGAGGVESLT